MAYTFICAESVPAAHSWCRANGVRLHPHTTRILTPRNSLGGRGCRLTAEDRVVVVGDVNWDIARIALTPAGLGSIVQPEFVR